MKPYYGPIDGITIYHGDCREVAPSLRADAVFADPPYGINKAEWDDSFPTDWFDAVADVAPVFGVTPGLWNILACPPRIGRASYRWTLAAHLINGMARGAMGFGNWIPMLVWATEDAGIWQQDGDCKDIVVGTDAKPDHPSPKPLRVMRWFLSRLPGVSVLDPFMGSGTTLVAARELGRRAIGIEIEERYCFVAAQRLSQQTLGLVVGV